MQKKKKRKGSERQFFIKLEKHRLGPLLDQKLQNEIFSKPIISVNFQTFVATSRNIRKIPRVYFS